MFTILRTVGGLLKKGLIADLKMVEMSQVLKDLKIVEISGCMHIRHYRLINAIPADIGQIFRYWMIYQKTFL